MTQFAACRALQDESVLDPASAAAEPVTRHATSTKAWHRVASVAEIPSRGVLPITLLGERLVVAFDGQEAFTLRDTCIHEALPLRQGRISTNPDGTSAITCPYHGWQWDRDGRCVGITSLPGAKRGGGLTNRRVKCYETRILDGLIWVLAGPDPAPATS